MLTLVCSSAVSAFMAAVSDASFSAAARSSATRPPMALSCRLTYSCRVWIHR